MRREDETNNDEILEYQQNEKETHLEFAARPIKIHSVPVAAPFFEIVII